MKRTRVIVAAMLLAAAAGACGGGKTTSDTNATSASTGGSNATTTTESGAAAKCKSEPLQASETGVTADTITIAVVADTGSPLRPGLFQGSVDAINAWAQYRNAEKDGVGCRKVAVKAYDSFLNPVNSKNSLTAACGSSFATVGTTALFLNDMKPIETCKDKAGSATGMPDFAVLQTEPAQQCSQFSFAVLPGQGTCPYSGTGPRTFQVASTPFDYYFKTYGKDTLHGVWVIPRDLPSTISGSMPGFRYSQELGIKRDAEFGASGLDTQAAYTPFVQAIKSHQSTYARNGLDYKGTVYERKEAAAQGVTSVKVWDCSVQCYDRRLISEGGAAVENQYVWMTLLPFEDKGSNPTLDAFLKYDKKPDGFGAQAWAAAELFAQAVDNVVAAKGPNALTRAALFDAVKNIHDFTAGGFIPPTDVGNKTGSKCVVIMQVKNGKFVRVDPEKPGTFDCAGTVGSITLDPIKSFKG